MKKRLIRASNDWLRCDSFDNEADNCAQTVHNVAQFICNKSGIESSFVFGQFCLESAWGQDSKATDDNNFGGVKVDGGDRYGSFATCEDFANHWIANFGKPYNLAQAQTPEEYVDLLYEDDGEGGHYCEDEGTGRTVDESKANYLRQLKDCASHYSDYKSLTWN